MSIDWITIRSEYISGGSSYRKLAEKYGLNKDTIGVRAKAEDWKGQRQAYLDSVQTNAIKKAERKITNAISEEAASKARIRLKLMQMAENWVMEQSGKVEDPADYRRMVQSCMDMGVFDEEIIKTGENREADALTKSLQELAEAMDNAGKQ